MPKKKKKEGKPQVHKELEGFELKINEFGQIVSNMDAEEMNKFLNKHVDDKKLRDRAVEEEVDETGLEQEATEDLELPNFEEIEKSLDTKEEDDDE